MTNPMPLEGRQIQEIYDELMPRYRDGLALADVREAVIEEAVARIRRRSMVLTAVSVEGQLRALFDKHVTNGLRAERATNLRAELEYILDAIQSPGEAAFMDPVLNVPHRIGNRQFDKVLRWWVVDDWAASMASRSRALADLSEATANFNDRAADMIAVMSAHSVRYVGELPFKRPGDKGIA